ncbi:hypothetical protein Y883_21350 [Luteibacter rhizovicinus DSM 16549]|nr:hypothetical protein Y883_21350 [Luteibacter rhizovicinus DSM 16549]
MIPIIFQPLTQRSFNHTKVDHAPNVVQSVLNQLSSCYYFSASMFRCNLKVKLIVVTVKVTTLTSIPYNTMTSANLM